MQIVINIPDDVYNNIKSNEEIITYITKDGGGSKALHGSLAIINGTILPKGHGRLIDADIIKDFKNKIKNYGKDYKFTQEEILNILERYEIKSAPTIIEADKESD